MHSWQVDLSGQFFVALLEVVWLGLNDERELRACNIELD